MCLFTSWVRAMAICTWYSSILPSFVTSTRIWWSCRLSWFAAMLSFTSWTFPNRKSTSLDPMTWTAGKKLACAGSNGLCSEICHQCYTEILCCLQNTQGTLPVLNLSWQGAVDYISDTTRSLWIVIKNWNMQIFGHAEANKTKLNNRNW